MPESQAEKAVSGTPGPIRRRGRGVRTAIADCPTCGDRCQADDTQLDAQRVWAQRHADRTGHTVLIETSHIRSYKPRSVR